MRNLVSSAFRHLPFHLIGAVALLTTSASAQETLAFPAHALPASGLDEVLELQPDRDGLTILTELDEVVLAGVPLPVGAAVDLELQRLEFDPSEVGVYLNGQRSAYDPGDLTLWKGAVRGVEGSSVFLALSSRGSYGWIHDGVAYTHVSSFPGPGGDWSNARMRLFSNRAHDAIASSAGPLGTPFCGTDLLTDGPVRPPFVNIDDLAPTNGPGAPKLECKMAIETDFQLYKVWNDIDAEQTYVLSLLAAASDRYSTEIDVELTFPYVQFYNLIGDPWSSQDSGGSAGDLLGEFRGAWAGKIPAGANLAHFLSGANLGGGVAYVGVLCSPQFGFAVSGNINGGTSFPVTQGSNTWDFYVFCHEAGHNFGSPHTHDYCPPLDECASGFGQCQDERICINVGTNMSYCHTCNGGMNNITTFFHPTVKQLMRNAAESSCLPGVESDTRVVLFADGFESGDFATGGWVPRNTKTKVKDVAAQDGQYGARIRKKSFLERSFDTTGFHGVELTYWRRTKNYDAGERLRVRWHDGTAWKTAEHVTQNGWGRVTIELPAGADGNPNLTIRFKSEGNLPKERADVDAVEITAVAD